MSVLAVGTVAQPAPAPVALTSKDVFTWHAGQFCLDGQPFAEISYNKFDLFWSLWQGLQDSRKQGRTDAWDTALAKQDAALRELHDLGCRTIRIFAVPPREVGQAWASDPGWRTDFFKAMDATLDLCDQHNIKVVYGLGAALLHDSTVSRKSRQGDEGLYDLVANPAAHSRQRLYNYLDTIVTRYRGRKTIAMWEITNELTNVADIGKRHGEPAPTLLHVATFFDAVARRIKACDPLRLVSTGGSHLREYAWNLYTGNGWKQRDTLDEYRQAYAAYFKNSAVDVIDTHYYAVRAGGYELAPDRAGPPVMMTPNRYLQIGRELGKGLIFGEYGALPSGWRDKGLVKQADADWFNGYNDPNAKKWIQHAVDDVVTAGVPLVYFWAYQSDRPQDQKSNPITFDLAATPELVRIIAEGSRRLKEKLHAH